VHFFSVGQRFVEPPDLEWSGWAGELGFDGGAKAI
jgi:hypothetical protein